MTRKQDPVVAALKQAATGLVYTSETDAPLEAFLWENSDQLTKKHLLELAGVDAGTALECETLKDFFDLVPPEDKPKFDHLAEVLSSHLSQVKVFKIGDEPEKTVYIVGETSNGCWAGLKTTVVET